MGRRLVVAAALLAVAASVPATPAHAHEPVVTSECDYGFADPDSDDVWTGYVSSSVVAYSRDPARNPVTVRRLHCQIYVNWEPQLEVETTGTGPVALIPPTPVTITADSVAFFDACQTIELVDALGDESTHFSCGPDPGPWNPLTIVDDDYAAHVAPVACAHGLSCEDTVLEAGFDVANAVFGEVEPAVCAAFREYGQDYPGYVEFRDDGDVYLTGEFFWDCPPYEVDW